MKRSGESTRRAENERKRRHAAPASFLLLGSLFTAACGSDAPTITEPPPEPEPTVPSAVSTWLAGAVIPFDGTDPAAPHADLEPLRALVGDARVVALGENTHGTRDFFLMKARILRFLVEEMGFDAFAIEATWPEANRLDRYVRDGVGEPATLLSGLYFWTWNTESVLQMIAWMRDHNDAGGSVGFYGFDMQYPGMAIHNVESFVAAVDPDASAEFGDRLSCLRRFANDPRGRFPENGYRDQTQEYRAACRRDLEWVETILEERAEAYVAASSPAELAHARRSARVALQYELMVAGARSRDAAMAENAIWLLDQLGPDGKIVLWAHNFHVSTLPQAMGFDLRQAYGPDMVVVGFSHAAGTFTAVTQAGSAFRGLSTHVLDPVRTGSYEEIFTSIETPRFMFDLRPTYASADSTAWLQGTRWFRSIGCCFDSTQPLRYWYQSALTSDFDVMIHVDQTVPTLVLPYQPPDVF